MSGAIELVVCRSVDGTLAAGDVRAVPATGGILGRSPDADVALPSPTVSRRHASLALEGGGWVLRSLTRANGTFVDGRPLGGEPVAIAEGARIQLGGVLLEVRASAGTRPYLEPLGTRSRVEPILAARWDGGHCTIHCGGRLLELEPQPARALGALLDQPGQPVHRWDILERVGREANLDRCMSMVRRALASALAAGSLPRHVVDEGIRATSADEPDPAGMTDEALMRRLVGSLRGYGYVLRLPAAVVESVHE